jgi:hypothetical protein
MGNPARIIMPNYDNRGILGFKEQGQADTSVLRPEESHG